MGEVIRYFIFMVSIIVIIIFVMERNTGGLNGGSASGLKRDGIVQIFLK